MWNSGQAEKSRKSGSECNRQPKGKVRVKSNPRRNTLYSFLHNLDRNLAVKIQPNTRLLPQPSEYKSIEEEGKHSVENDLTMPSKILLRRQFVWSEALAVKG